MAGPSKSQDEVDQPRNSKLTPEDAIKERIHQEWLKNRLKKPPKPLKKPGGKKK